MKRSRTETAFELAPISLDKSMKDTNYFDKAISYGNMRRALKRCCRNVRWKDSVVGYELHASQNTHKLIDSIRNGTYQISQYQHFTIYEPKKREIVATRIADRQVQMALCQAGLYEDFVEHFIYDNCACQTGKGTDFCLKRIKKHMTDYFRAYGSEGWVLKCDVHQFFPSTLHEVAKQAVRKRIRDPMACDYVCNVIDSFGGDRGIGLGSQISQLVELAVLDDLDHFIKERLQIKHYVRYMDDFILVHHDKQYLDQCKAKIEEQLSEIGLSLNKKTTIYNLKQGVKFLQWRFCYTASGRIVMHMASKKMGKQRRRLKKILLKEAAGDYSEGTGHDSLIAWRANAARGDTWYRQIRMRNYYYDTKARVYNGNNLRAIAQS